MATRLRREGIAKFYEFSQSAMRAESDKMLYDLITQKRLAHDGNGDLRQHIDNADRKADNQDRKMRIVKREESLKIDLAVCLGMSAYRCLYLNL
jgi:phage terminase large subunit-like protein